MRKINFKKIFNFVFWILILSGLIVTLGFVNTKEKDIIGKAITVNVTDADEEGFIDKEDIMEFLRSRHDTVVGQSLAQIDINLLEKALLTQPSIKDAQVSLSINGIMNIEINQRKPIVRVFNRYGESYYIDHDAKLMLLSENYTARVLTVHGNIFERYANMFKYDLKEIEENKFLSQVFLLDDIYILASYIEKDTLLSNLIQQVNINENKEFEFYPSIGEQKIIFGEIENLKEKFEKLKTFYEEGLNSTDWWNRYSIINLKFEKQVVCTKK